jgi:hypothetical protein
MYFIECARAFIIHVYVDIYKYKYLYIFTIKIQRNTSKKIVFAIHVLNTMV